MLGCDNAIIEAVDWHQDDPGDGTGRGLAVVAHVRPRSRHARRCGICGRKRPGVQL